MADIGDWLGPITQAAGSLWAANQNRNTANQYFGMGQPYRDRLSAISANPNAYYDSPEATALANASDRRYSGTFGNPAGAGASRVAALEAMRQGYGQERDRLFNYGGGGIFNHAAPGAQGNATNAGYGLINSLGPIMELLRRGGLGGGSADIGSLYSNSNYMGGGGMGFGE